MNTSEITEEIIKLEEADTSWQNVQRLAWLYIVRDHLMSDRVPVVANKIQNVMPGYSGEFGEVVSGVSVDDVMSVLNEHMQVVKILLPKEYEAVINRIREPSE